MSDQEAATQEEPVAPVDDKDQYITVKVVGPNTGDEILFRLKMTMRLGKLKMKVCERMGCELGVLRFLFDGKRINDDDTPSQLEMEDGDLIEVYQEQLGGGLK